MARVDDAPIPTILPDEVQAKIDRGEPMRVVCPAGEPVRDGKTGRQGVYCKIEKAPITLAGSPLAVACFCCHEYTACPTWQADKENDPIVQRVEEATKRRAQERITERHIETGVRFDDSEDRETAKWMEDEIKLQNDPNYPHEEAPARGHSQIALPPGYDGTTPKESDDDGTG